MIRRGFTKVEGFLLYHIFSLINTREKIIEEPSKFREESKDYNWGRGNLEKGYHLRFLFRTRMSYWTVKFRDRYLGLVELVTREKKQTNSVPEGDCVSDLTSPL